MGIVFEQLEHRTEQAACCAGLIAGALFDAIESRGWARFAGAGGGTPRMAYRFLSEAQLPWSKVLISLTDERLVAPDHPDSNQQFLRENLLINEASQAALIPLWTGDGDLSGALRAGSKMLSALWPFDVVLLGMGDDGHIASLFPGSQTISEQLDLDRPPGVGLTTANKTAPLSSRLSLSLSALLATELVILLITGERKRQVLEAALVDPSLPIHHVLNQRNAPVHILWAV